MNPIADTLITKNLKKVLEKENKKFTQELIKQVVTDARGDIRSAINNLQIYYLGNKISPSPTSKNKNTK